MVRPTLKELQRQVREDAIIDAAHELFGEQGYAEMSMDDLAARVGISKATLYQHFPSKEEVAIHVIVRLMQHGEMLLDSVAPETPAIAGIEEWLRNGLAQRVDAPTQGMGLMPLSIKEHPRYREIDARIFAHASALIERAKAEGDIAPRLATPIAARMLMRLFSGDFNDYFRDDQISGADVTETLVEIVLNGLRVRSRNS